MFPRPRGAHACRRFRDRWRRTKDAEQMSSWSIIKWVGLFVAAVALFFALSAPERTPPPARTRAEAPGTGSDSLDAPVLSKIDRLRAEREVGEVGAALDNLTAEIARWDEMIQEHHASALG